MTKAPRIALPVVLLLGLLACLTAIAGCGGGLGGGGGTPSPGKGVDTGPQISSVSPNSGSPGGGTTILITGGNFVTGTTVSLGGVDATGVTVISGAQLQVTTPAHAPGLVDVKVQNPDNQSATLANGFNYLGLGVSRVNPASGSTLGGTTVTITGSGFVAGVTVQFGGVAAQFVNFDPNVSTQIQAVTPAHAAGAVDVVVQNPDFTSATLAGAFTYVGPLQIVTTTLADATVGSQYNVSINVTGGTTPYTWTVLSGQFPPGLALGSVTGAIAGIPSQAGQFDFTVQVIDSAAPPNGAVVSQSYTLNVQPRAVGIGVSIAPSAAVVQVNGQQQFTATVTGTPNTAVTWSVNGIVGGNATFGTITATGLYTAPAVLPNPDTVTVMARSQADPTQAASALVTIFPAGGALQVTVAGTTATQAMLTYVAPDANPCTLEVSESTAFTPLVHDVDPALFAGSNQDAGGGASRYWVIGKKQVNQASDGILYSRALQANTSHFFRLVCTGQIAVGSFDTMNIPNGKTFAERMQVDANGNPIFPDVQESRNNTIVDPLTGALVRRLTLANDTNSFKPPSIFSGGFFHMCANQLANGGYRCVIPGSTGAHRMYWVDPADGLGRYLGVLRYSAGPDFVSGFTNATNGNFDSQNPDLFYTTANTSSTAPVKNVILKGTYTGGDVELPRDGVAPFTFVNLTPAAGNQTLTDLIAAFDSRFDPVQYGQRCDIYGVQLQYLMISCRRQQQNSPAWIVIVDLGDKLPLGSCVNCLKVVAATPMFANPSSRWCGHHSQEYLGDSPFTMVVSQGIKAAGETGPWQVTSGAVNAADTNFTVSGEPTTPNLPPDGINFLMAVAAGDIFQFEDAGRELVKVTAKNSSTSWSVQRGYGGTSPASHAAGAKLTAFCDAVRTGKSNIWWRFLDDPFGVDGTNTFYIVDTFIGGGHRVSRQPFDISEGYVIRQGSWPEQFTSPPTFFLEESPIFAGIQSNAAGNSYQKHPAYDQEAATPEEKLWFSDIWPFFGGTYSDSAVLISGSLYKYRLAATHQFDPSKLPYFAMSGAVPLKDVSGPGSVLSSLPADNFKFCVVKNAGECVAGSLAGEIYFNVPILKYALCRGSDSITPTEADICVNHTATYGHALPQFGLQPADLVGTTQGKPRYGAGKSRVLVSQAMLGKYRKIPSTSNPRPLPDGSWMIFPSRLVDVDTTTNLLHMFLAKVPPQPADDGIDRTDFIDVTVTVPPFGGAVSARVEYGYEENGPRASLFCTQRPEICSVPAAPGGQVILQGIPQRVLFYRVVYLDAGNNPISTGPINAAVVP